MGRTVGMDGVLKLYFEGDLTAGFAFGGQVAGRVDEILSVRADRARDGGRVLRRGPCARPVPPGASEPDQQVRVEAQPTVADAGEAAIARDPLDYLDRTFHHDLKSTSVSVTCQAEVSAAVPCAQGDRLFRAVTHCPLRQAEQSPLRRVSPPQWDSPIRPE